MGLKVREDTFSQIQQSEKESTTCRADNTMLKAHNLKNAIPRANHKETGLELTNVKKAEISPTSIQAMQDFEPQDEARELQDFAFSTSEELSDLLGFRVTHLDVLMLFIQLLILSIKDRELQKQTRRYERLCQLEHMLNVVENYKQQGKWLLTSSIGAGVLGIVSGLSPAIGLLWGDKIRDALGSFSLFSALKGMRRAQISRMLAKITGQMSEVYKSTGQIHNSYAEGSRTYDDAYKQLYESWAQERTRSLEESLQEWKAIENFLSQQLQWQHDSIRTLYQG